MQEGRFEVDAVAEVAQQAGDRRAAGFVQQPLRGHRADRIGDLRIAVAEFAERRGK